MKGRTEKRRRKRERKAEEEKGWWMMEGGLQLLSSPGPAINFVFSLKECKLCPVGVEFW